MAYNFLVDSYGQIFEGRQGSLISPVRGDATGGSQGYALLCCFIGDHRDVAPTGTAQSAMVALLAWLAGTYNIDPAPGSTTEFVSRGSNLHAEGTVVLTPTITGHRTMSRTSCPGDQAFALVRDSFPQQVSDVLSLARSAPTASSVAAVASTAAPTTSIVESPTSTTASSTSMEPVPETIIDASSGTANGGTAAPTTTPTVTAGSDPFPSSASPTAAATTQGPRDETAAPPNPAERSGSILDLWPIASMVAGLSMLLVAATKHLRRHPDPVWLGGHEPDVETETERSGSQQ